LDVPTDKLSLLRYHLGSMTFVWKSMKSEVEKSWS